MVFSRYPDKFIRLLVLIFFSISLSFAQTGIITGKVADASDGSPLWGTNVVIMGTTVGTISDAEGKFTLPSVPAGTRTILFRYVGYLTDSITIEVKGGMTATVNSKLKSDVIQGKEVVITAQLQGQQAAINQQLNSNTIVNIVSSDKIQALPDANVAESVSRLSGISIQRDAGEGSKVVVRGLSPKFNSITINGERIPATDPNDRSVDLSIISSDILAGIEVFKALTPDKDGDAIGGTINLVTKKAPNDFRLDIRAQNGYNSFVDKLGQYKFSLTASDRFFDEKLGGLVSLNSQRANRSSDVLTAAYIGGTSTAPTIEISDLYLIARDEIRDRYSAGINLDYTLGDGFITFNNFFSETDRNEVRRRKAYRVDAFRTEYDLRGREIKSNVISNSFHGEYTFWGILLDGQASYSRSLQKTPFSNYSRFQEIGSFNNGMIVNQGPEKIPPYAINDLGATWFQYGTFNPDRVDDKDVTALMNVKIPFSVNEDVSGYFKIGGKYRKKNRMRNVDEFRTDFGVTDSIAAAHPNDYALYQNHILISNFLDPSFSADNFLEGKYIFGPGLNQSKLDDFHSTYTSYYTKNFFTDLNDYFAGEKIAAAYVMMEINLFNAITIIPGVRYEKTSNDYNGKFGKLKGNLGQIGTIRDSLGGRTYEEYLPMFHIKYLVTEGFDVRLAFTKSLSRPDYFNLVPYQQISEAEQTVAEGNPNLLHTKSTNYDLFLSFYNRFGLFTAGTYYKKLKNIDYISSFRVVSNDQFNGYTRTTPVNSPDAKVYGVELDLQANFLFVPEPFDGIILSANVSRIYSETYFPYFEIGPRSKTPPYKPIIINSFRKGRLPGQADWIYNITLGYEKGGFSGRISSVHQGQILQVVGVRSELDGFTDAFTRYDASISQAIYDGISIYANANNINNVPDGAFLGSKAFPTNAEYYGWSVDLGLKFKY